MFFKNNNVGKGFESKAFLCYNADYSSWKAIYVYIQYIFNVYLI